MRILDVRHEQTAVFAAEATGKLTRRPGPRRAHRRPRRHQRRQRDRAGAVRRLADGRGRRPGAAEPLGQRQPAGARPPADRRAGHQARRAPIHDGRRGRRRRATRRSPLAGSLAPRPGVPRRPDGRVLRHRRPSTLPAARPAARRRARPRRARRGSRALLADAERPVLVLGTDVWADGAEEAALRLVEAAGIPAITNGMGRGVVPGGHPLLVTKARGAGARQRRPGRRGRHAARLPARLRRLRRQGRRRRRRRSCTSPTPPARSRGHADARRLRVRRPDRGPRRRCRRRSSAADRRPDWSAWVERPAGHRRARPPRATPSCSRAEADPIHPARIYGELVPRLADDAVVIGDGGDFVSLRRQVRRAAAARRLARPRPLRLPRRRPRLRDRRPARPPVGAGRAAARRRRGRLLADGRRHAGPPRPAGRDGGAATTPPGAWRRARCRCSTATTSPPTSRRRRRYDEVVTALGGAGETVTDPRADRPGARPRVRRRRAVPGQRDHRRRRGLPARHVRDLSAVRITSRPGPTELEAVGDVTVAAYAAFDGRSPRTTTSTHLRDAATRDREAELWVAVVDDGERARHRDALPARARRGASSRSRARASSGCSRSPRPPSGAGVGEALVRHCRRPVPASRAPPRWCSRSLTAHGAPRTGSTSGSASPAAPSATGRRCPAST